MTAMPSSRRAEVTLPADDQILITREFDAPRRLVYRAWTTPELVRRWWSGRRGEMTLVEMDFRVGGTWRYVMNASGGHEVGFHGEYREIVPDERIVWTEVYEGAPEGEPALVTATFSEAEGRTRLSLLTEVESKTVRDMIVESGMEIGVQEQMEILDEILPTLR
jgi:uncharacterized protein YndB with AHSA1/START domain